MKKNILKILYFLMIIFIFSLITLAITSNLIEILLYLAVFCIVIIFSIKFNKVSIENFQIIQVNQKINTFILSLFLLLLYIPLDTNLIPNRFKVIYFLLLFALLAFYYFILRKNRSFQKIFCYFELYKVKCLKSKIISKKIKWAFIISIPVTLIGLFLINEFIMGISLFILIGYLIGYDIDFSLIPFIKLKDEGKNRE